MRHKLTATAVKQVKPSDKAQKLTDGAGLYLFIHPQGGKYWRFDYRFADRLRLLL